MTDDREPWLERFQAHYHAPTPVDPELGRRIAESVSRARRPRVRLLSLRLLGDWLFAPLPLTLTPVRLIVGAAAAAALILTLAGPGWRHRETPPGELVATAASGRSERPTAANPAATDPELVRFVFRAPRGAAVALVGDFNGWDPVATPMQMLDAEGVWSASILLPPGRHVYAFVIDGTTWVPDPTAPLAPEDGFGSRNSVVLVGGAYL